MRLRRCFAVIAMAATAAASMIATAPQASADAGTCESTWGALWDGTQAAGYCGLSSSQVTVRGGTAPISGSYGSWQASSADGVWTATVTDGSGSLVGASDGDYTVTVSGLADPQGGDRCEGMSIMVAPSTSAQPSTPAQPAGLPRTGTPRAIEATIVALTIIAGALLAVAIAMEIRYRRH